MKKILLFTFGLSMALTSCNDFLDELPDNRTEIDSKEKIAKILVSAYPNYSYCQMAEFMSDNVDDYLGGASTMQERYATQIAYWGKAPYGDVTSTEDDYDTPYQLWQASYKAIACANEALQAIEELGTPSDLLPYKGEALLCRAYNHFILVNMFSLNYNKTTSATDLGIPYVEKVEENLVVNYTRGTVAETYEKIEKDLAEGLPLISDDAYDVPKYHFNQKAAYTFASRFYLYYEKWDKVIEYSNKVLGSNAAAYLRDWQTMAAQSLTQSQYAVYYTSADRKANLMLMTAYSMAGTYFAAYGFQKRINHTQLLAGVETYEAKAPWGSPTYSWYYMRPTRYVQPYFTEIVPKLPYIFEYSDIVNQIGDAHSVVPVFQTEEALLNRAEAYVLTNRFDEAVADLVTWQHNIYKSGTTLTRTNINSFYNNADYSQALAPTTKKELHPDFAIASGEQENLIQCVLHARRIQTIGEGLRWFDNKRYGIEIYRRTINANAQYISSYETLSPTDKCRAVQIPVDVSAAGIEKNPR